MLAIYDFQSVDGRPRRPIDVVAQREKPRRGNYLASRFRFFEHVCAVGLLPAAQSASVVIGCRRKGLFADKKPVQTIRPISIIGNRRAI